jgi:hypothetical protein
MPVTLTGAGGLFTRLGKIGYFLNSVHAFLGTGDLSAGGLKSVGVLTDGVQDQYEAARSDLVTGLYAARDTYRGAHGQVAQYLKGLAQDTLVEMVNDDSPLASKTVALALAELIDQMDTAAASVSRPTVSVSVTAGGSNTGTGVCVASVTGADGVQLDYVFDEVIVARATADAQAGTSTAGQEPFTATAPAAQTDALKWDWPDGSGGQVQMTAVDAASNNSGGNVLQNSSWATFTTANTPDNWPIAVGTAGTHILQASGSNAYKGSSGLAFVGNASTLPEIAQPFNTTPSTTAGAGGTSYRILPQTVYMLNVWHKVSDNLATGTFTISLVDGSGTVINDDEGAANTLTITVDSLTTSWSNSTAVFRTPSVLPATVKLRIRNSSGAALSAHTLYLDHLALTAATRLYTGGPYAAIFSGATEFVTGDKFSIDVNNNYGSKWALFLERTFSLRQLGLRVPSSGSPTIDDTLFA